MYASGPNMVKAAQSNGWKSGTDFTELAESARQGNAIAIDVINKGTHALAQSIVNTAGALDIHTVVIGGGVSQAGDIYWNPLMANIEQEAQHEGFLNDLEILPAKLQRDAGLIGASLAISNSQGNL
jgi:glucokinase